MKKSTIKKTAFFMITCALFAILYSIPTFFAMKWVTEDGVTKTKLTDLACDKKFYTIYYVIMNACFQFLLPTISLIVFNILIYRKVSNLHPQYTVC